MPEYASALVCLSIVIVAILITEIVKFIMKKIAEKKGKTFDCKKWEYLFAAISILISGVGVVCFLKFGAGVNDAKTILKYASIYAGSVQTVYLFIVQLVRKGGVGIYNAFSVLFEKVKETENPIETLPEIIKNETINGKEDTEPLDDVASLKKKFDGIIKKNYEQN